MGEALLLTLLGTAGVGAAIWAILKHFETRDRIASVWRVAAERLGGTYEVVHGTFFSAGGMTIRARVEGATVTVDHYTTGSGNTQVTFTRIRTTAPGSGALLLRVTREGLLSAVSKVLGGQDVQVGVPAFDERYRITASDEEQALAWLDEATRTAIVGAEPYTVTIESGEARAERIGLEDSVRKLVDTVRGLCLVAGAGRRLLGRWEALAAALGGKVVARQEAFEVNGGTMTIVERGGAQVLVDVLKEQVGRLSGRSRLWTRLRARHPAAGTDGRFAIVDATGKGMLEDPRDLVASAPPGGSDEAYEILASERSWGDAHLDSATWQRILALEPTAITGEPGEVTVLLPGLVLDERRTVRALELATQLATASAAGPYR